MTDPESTMVPRRLDPGLGLDGDKDPRTFPYSPSHLGPGLHYGTTNEPGLLSRGTAAATRPSAADDATRFAPAPVGANSTTSGFAHSHSQSTSQPSSSSPEYRAPAGHGYPPQLPNRHHLALSGSNSQRAASTNGVDPVFTPPASGGRLSPGNTSAHGSSQESQLLQLSQIAAAQARIPEDAPDMAPGASRKRMADGVVKHTRDTSNASPGHMVGHSRNTSTVSVASTAGSRIGEVLPSQLPSSARAMDPALMHLQLSAELKARLSYAMVKVNHGWQAHSIDQVETLASHAASPASSASTVHLRNESSASPQLSAVSHRASNNTTPATGPQHQYSARPGDPQWRESPQSTSRGSSASPVKTAHSLAPPVSIQPSQPPLGNPRREPNPRHVPSFLSGAHHTSPRAGLHTTSPYLAPGRPHRSAMTEAMLVSPHTNVREQDAIESLLFMSSPGNSANLKHAFPTSASQPLPSHHQQHHHARTALPTSQPPRKSLPSGRPAHHARSQSHSQPTVTKRVGFETNKSPSAMDIDDSPSLSAGSPMSISRGTPRRRLTVTNGTGTSTSITDGRPLKQIPLSLPVAIPVSAGLTVSSARQRPALGDDEIDRMLDRAVAAAEAGESDSEGEIEIPVSSVRGPRGRGGGGGVGVGVS
ncbi:hypothetical protein NEMBOFW57_007878 [Staphylotrichum longicolle]|uniref:Uncharacterized protein n=1 Tax=Staphylotrichum longicolle TaxID=669026 RepID=A0AAD4HXT5_9PEZI|nr:hypothetical protein NEMBOFW57_007878 [Staphylotrichum longicolle]